MRKVDHYILRGRSDILGYAIQISVSCKDMSSVLNEIFLLKKIHVKNFEAIFYLKNPNRPL